MINFGNGRRISTIAISTALGYDGRGIFPYTTHRDYGDMIRTANATGTTRFSKSMTRHKWSGNFHLWRPWTWKYIQNFGDDGMLNAYGLTNKGVEKHSQEIAWAVADGIQVIPNFFPEFGKERERATKEVFDVVDIFRSRLGKKFWALELNFSCPNTKECIIDNVENATWYIGQVKALAPGLIIIAKISMVHPVEFAERLRKAGADVLHASNTIPYSLLFVGESPLQKVGGGGVSGGLAFKKAFEYNARVIEYFDGPVILGCGIVDDEKLNLCFELLKSKRPDRSWAVSVCTAALRRPGWVKEVIQDFNS